MSDVMLGTRPASRSVAILALVIILAGIGFKMTITALSDFHALSDPIRALSYDAHNPTAAVTSVAIALLQGGSDNAQKDLAILQDALARDPLTPNGFSTLGLLYDGMGQSDLAMRAFDAASTLSWHDRAAHDVQLHNAIMLGDVAMAMREVDAMQRMARDVSDRDLRSIFTYLNGESARSVFVASLAQDPPWRTQILKRLAESPTPLDIVLDIRTKLEAAARPYSRDEMRPILWRMLRENRNLDAYVSWLKWMPEEERPKSVGLYNGNFRYPVSGLPFDWTFEEIKGAEMRVTPFINGNVLSVDFLGPRMAFKNVSQILVLPEGHYRFSGEEAARNVQSENGLTWRLACLTKDETPIFATDGLKGEVFWSPFAVEFDVRSNCAFQKLTLEMPVKVALDRVISGRVSYRNLKIEAVDANAP